jgi:ESCRT-II complex subunit
MKIDETGQKNAVLTLYELSQGDLAMNEGFPWLGFTYRRIPRDGSGVTEEGVADISKTGRCDNI